MTTVTVRCISCKKTREIGPGEIAPGDMPFCDCGSVMVAVKATAKFNRKAAPSKPAPARGKEKR